MVYLWYTVHPIYTRYQPMLYALYLYLIPIYVICTISIPVPIYVICAYTYLNIYYAMCAISIAKQWLFEPTMIYTWYLPSIYRIPIEKKIKKGGTQQINLRNLWQLWQLSRTVFFELRFPRTHLSTDFFTWDELVTTCDTWLDYVCILSRYLFSPSIWFLRNLLQLLPLISIPSSIFICMSITIVISRIGQLTTFFTRYAWWRIPVNFTPFRLITSLVTYFPISKYIWAMIKCHSFWCLSRLSI